MPGEQRLSVAPRCTPHSGPTFAPRSLLRFQRVTLAFTQANSVSMGFMDGLLGGKQMQPFKPMVFRKLKKQDVLDTVGASCVEALSHMSAKRPPILSDLQSRLFFQSWQWFRIAILRLSFSNGGKIVHTILRIEASEFWNKNFAILWIDKCGTSMISYSIECSDCIINSFRTDKSLILRLGTKTML